MREDAISLGGSNLVQIWFSFPDPDLEVLNSEDLGRSAARIADLDGDGQVELLAAGGHTLHIGRSAGDTTFAFTRRPLPGRDVERLEIVDIDGDARPDIAVIDESSLTIVRTGP